MLPKGIDMDLSVCIVTYNTSELLRKCLVSIYRQTEGIAFEVIVVDNGSIDGTAEMIRTEFPQTHLIVNDRNLFFTKANNQAAKISQGRYVLILNSDTEIARDSLRKLAEYMDAHPKVGGVAPRQVNYDGTWLTNARPFHTTLSMILRCETVGWLFRHNTAVQQYLAIANWNWESERVIDVAEDSCFLLRRAALDEIGLYDERMLLYYTEDDLCQRLRRANWQVMYNPDVQIVHGKSQTARRVGYTPIMAIRVRDQAVYCHKYLKPWQTWIVLFVAQLDLSVLKVTDGIRRVLRKQSKDGTQ